MKHKHEFHITNHLDPELADAHYAVSNAVDPTVIDALHKSRIMKYQYEDGYVRGSGIYDHLQLYKDAVADQPMVLAAHQQIVAANHGLIGHILEKKGYPVHLRDDLFQDAWAGLSLAAWRFDPNEGYTFSTHAHSAIAGAIQVSFHDLSHSVSVPRSVAQAASSLKQHSPTLADVKVVDSGRYDAVAKALNTTLPTARRVVQYLAGNFVPETLSASDTDHFDYDGNPTTRDSAAAQLASPDFSDEVVEKIDIEDTTRNVLGMLSSRERRIIELRYGFVDGSKHTLESLGTEMGVTKERIRQIESKALSKARARIVAGYIVREPAN